MTYEVHLKSGKEWIKTINQGEETSERNPKIGPFRPDVQGTNKEAERW